MSSQAETENAEQLPTDAAKTKLVSKAVVATTRGRRYRLAQTFLMQLAYLSLGMTSGINGPTIIDMKNLFRSDYEHFSQALMMKSVGILAGSFIGAMANDRFQHKISLFLAFNMLLFGVSAAAMPWYPSLILLGALYMLQGICHGCVNVVVGAYGLIVSAVWAVLVVWPTPEDLWTDDKTPKSIKQIFSPGSCTDGRPLYATFMLVGLFFTYAFHVSRMNTMTVWLYAISVETPTLSFSSSQGVFVTTGYFVACFVGRLVLGTLTHYISIKIAVFFELVMQVGAFAGLTFLGLTSQTMLWVWVCVASFVSSPSYPAIMSWADRYLEVTGLVVAIIDSGIGVGVFASLWTCGYIYQHYHAQAVFYLMLVCTGGVFIVVSAMQAVGAVHGDRFKKTLNRTEHVITSHANGEERSPLIK